MKDVKSTLLDRRSIRRYERDDIPQETMDLIYEAIRNTPTSYNGQQFSVIDIDDQSVKEKLYELTGQKQIKTCCAPVAAESCGLGTCPIGYARTAAPEAIAKMMDLPEGVFVVCGLAIGVPREMPDLKPKQPRELMIFHNAYRRDNMVPDLLKYDKEISEYNATRTGTKTDNDWAGHIIGYYREAMAYKTPEALRRRGFDVKQ